MIKLTVYGSVASKINISKDIRWERAQGTLLLYPLYYNEINFSNNSFLGVTKKLKKI